MKTKGWRRVTSFDERGEIENLAGALRVRSAPRREGLDFEEPRG